MGHSEERKKETHWERMRIRLAIDFRMGFDLRTIELRTAGTNAFTTLPSTRPRMTSFMQLWSSRPICEGYRPRQFEYHPTRADLLVFGTMEGEVAVANHESNTVLNVDRWAQGQDHEGHNSILGLCWLRRHPTKFLAGSSYGTLNICDFAAPTGEDVDGTKGGGGGGGGGGGVTGGGSDTVDSTVGDDAVGGDGARAGATARPTPPAVFRGAGVEAAGAPSASASSSAAVGGIQTRKFEHFEKLTSVHVNCADAFVVASGYCNSVKVYDVGTAKVVSTYEDIHTDHINISRFTNHSPAIFGTSSFDKTVKLWDLRADSKRGPIYCRTSPSNQGHVMLCFSPNDQYAEEERKRSDLQMTPVVMQRAPQGPLQCLCVCARACVCACVCVCAANTRYSSRTNQVDCPSSSGTF